jgi:hypothetical protein
MTGAGKSVIVADLLAQIGIGPFSEAWLSLPVCLVGIIAPLRFDQFRLPDSCGTATGCFRFSLSKTARRVQQNRKPKNGTNSLFSRRLHCRAAALQRLEEIEERAHARLMRAIESGNQFQVKAAQEFYLRCSETLRRLDLAVEAERRTALEQIPRRQVAAVAIEISTLLRLSFEQFLGSESAELMATTDLGAFKFLAIERFRGILHATVKRSLRTDAPIPPWAAAQVVEAWNVPDFWEFPMPITTSPQAEVSTSGGRMSRDY